MKANTKIETVPTNRESRGATVEKPLVFNLDKAKRLLALLLGGVCLCLPPAIYAEDRGLPDCAGAITDTISLLSAAKRQAIASRLKTFEEKKGAQIFVLIVDSTGSESIEDYAQRVFDAWKIGRKGVDDGLLFLVARADRRVRIHTGYGLEGVLPDATAKRIIDRLVLPAFREERWEDGLESALNVILALLDGEALPDVLTVRWSETVLSNSIGWFIGGAFSIIAAIILCFRQKRRGVLALGLNLVVWTPALIFLPELLSSSIWFQNIIICLVALAGLFSIGHLLMTIQTGSSVYGGSTGASSGTGGSSPSQGSSASGSSGKGGSSGGGGASSGW